MRPPYELSESGMHGRISESILGLPWLGPRQVAEAHSWEMLSLGGTPSRDLPDHVIEATIAAARHPEYPGSLGSLPLREAIAERVGAELGTLSIQLATS